MLFKDLQLIQPIQSALEQCGYTAPTPIQAAAIPHALEGRDVLGCAQTGTGKTAAFALPILQLVYQRLQSGDRSKGIKALILTPTRELAIQIEESFNDYGKGLHLHHQVIFGGVSQVPQVSALKRGTDILVATPGRLLDLMQQGYVHLNDIRFFVLDEADRMLDMGFIHDVKKVVAKLPTQKQTLFFSATMPSEIAALAASLLKDPAKVEVTPVSSTVDKIDQVLYYVDKEKKKDLLKTLLQDPSIVSALVFTRTKHGADKVVKDLLRNRITAEAIHGNKSQNARQRALANFKSGATRILVATDIAARGIDIELLSHVFNYELPDVPETYVHRIGRTGRAGASGKAIAFCEQEELINLRDIQKLIQKEIPVASQEGFEPSFNPQGRGAQSLPAQAQKGQQMGRNNGRPDQRGGGQNRHSGHAQGRERGRRDIPREPHTGRHAAQSAGQQQQQRPAQQGQPSPQQKAQPAAQQRPQNQPGPRENRPPAHNGGNRSSHPAAPGARPEKRRSNPAEMPSPKPLATPKKSEDEALPFAVKNILSADERWN